MAPIAQTECRNRLLAHMDAEDFDALIGDGEKVSLALRSTLFEHRGPIEHVHFMERGFVSLVAQSDQGRIEVGMFGREGVTGVAALLDDGSSVLKAIVQGEGEAIRFPSARFREIVLQRPTLLRLVLRYIHFLLTQTAQTAFANANYGVEPRLARSLLMVQDRLETDELHLTHTVLSFMLGTRRASVTDATHILEGCHLIRASRGTITVRDRKGLMALAGDAYGTSEAEYERLMRAQG